MFQTAEARVWEFLHWQHDGPFVHRQQHGLSSLSGVGVTLDWCQCGRVSVLVNPASSVAAGSSTTFIIRFALSLSAQKTAALHVVSNAPGAKSSFDINLTARSSTGNPLGGTLSIGPTGYYLSISSALADIQTSGSMLRSAGVAARYVSSVESFPLTFTNLGTTATKPLTVRPQAGAAGSSSPARTAARQPLTERRRLRDARWPARRHGYNEAADHRHSNPAGVALRFDQRGRSNTVEYLTPELNTGGNSGTVVFGTTTRPNGNDNNSIDHCDIRDGASQPGFGISSTGSSGATAQNTTTAATTSPAATSSTFSPRA